MRMPMDNAERLLTVIRAMNELGPSSVLDLHRATRVSRPAIYRLLEVLSRHGYVARIPGQSRFRLTSEIRRLSDGFRDDDWIVQLGAPVIERLQRAVLWPTSLATFSKGCMIVRETTRHSSPFVFDTGRVGIRLPILASSLGIAYLSFCSGETREIILNVLKQSSDALDALAEDAKATERLLRQTAACGYAFRHGGIEPKTASIAVAILLNDEAVASICVTFAASAVSRAEAVEKFLPHLRAAASEIGSYAVQTV